MFLWKAARNALPLGKNLAVRGVAAAALCKRCGEEEDSLHIFLRCPFACKVWEQVPAMGKLAVNRVDSFQSLLVKAGKMVSLPPVGLGTTPLFPWILWFLWKARNLLLFEDKVVTEDDTLLKAIKEARSWQAAKELQSQKKPNQKAKERGSAHCDAVSCFSDASWLEQKNVCGMGWIFKDPQKVVIQQGSSSRPFVASALVAEALAMKAAITAALALGVSRLACFSDCQVLVCLLVAEGQANELDGILEDIRRLCSGFLSCSFHHVSRLYNAEADSLAKAALASSLYPPLGS